MADTARRVIEVDVKLGTGAIEALKALQDVARSSEDSLKKLQNSAKSLDDAFGSSSKADRFLQSLKDQAATIGLTIKQLNEYKAKQLDVAAAAQPLIDNLDKEQKAYKEKTDALAAAAKQERDAIALVKEQNAARAKVVDGLKAEIAVWGLTGDALTRYNAQVAGNLSLVEPLLQKRAELRRSSEAEAAAAELTAKSLRDGAAAVAAYAASGRDMVSTLQTEISAWGKDADAILLQKAALAGVRKEVEPLIAQRNELRRATEAEASANALAAKALEEGLAATKSYAAAGRDMVATLQAEISAWGKDADAILLQKAALAGVRAEIEPLVAKRNELRRVAEEQAAAEKANAAALLEGANAVKTYADFGRELIAAKQREIAAIGQSDQARQQEQATLAGVGAEMAKLLAAEREELNFQAAKTSALKSQTDALRAAEAEEERRVASIERIRASLERELATMGKGRAELVEYDLRLLGAGKAELDLARQVDDATKAIERQTKATNDAAAAARKAESDQRAFAKSGQDFIKNLQYRKDTQDLTPKQKLQFDANAAGVGAQAKPLIDGLKDIESGAHGAGGAMERLGLGTVAVRREFIVLAHEASQGRYTNFGGSLMVLAEQMDLMGKLATPAGLAIAGVAVAVVAVGFVLAKGAIDLQHFNDAVFLTGNYAGQTAGSMSSLSHAVSESAGVTIGKAHDITEALVASGRFGPQAIGAVATAAANLARVTGKSGEDVVKQFEGMSKGVYEWAKTTNESFHFTTAAHLDYIRQLELTGRSQDAMVAASTAFSSALDKQKEDVTDLTKIWRTFTGAISGAARAIVDFSKPTTPTTKVSDIESQLAAAKKARENAVNEVQTPGDRVLQQFNLNKVPEVLGLGAGGDTAARREQVKALQLKRADDEIARLTSELDKAKQDPKYKSDTLKAAAAAANDLIQKESAEGQETLRSMYATLRTGNKTDEDIDKIVTAAAKRRKGGGEESSIRAELQAGIRLQKDLKTPLLTAEGKETPVYPSKAAIDEDIALIKKKDQSKAGTELENAFKSRMRSLEQESAVVKDQIKQYELLGKVVNQSELAKFQADPAFKNLGAADRTKGEKLAKSIDDDRAKIKGLEAIARVEKEIAGIHDEDIGPSFNARDTEIQTRLLQEQKLGVDKTSESYAKLAERIKVAVNLRFDAKLPRTLLEQTQAIQEQADKLDAETAVIGLNNVERAKAIELQKIEAQVRKSRRDNPGAANEALIKAEAQVQKDAILPAIDRGDTVKRLQDFRDELKKLEEERAAIGLTDIEQKKLAATYKITEDAKRRAYANPDLKDQINEEATRQIEAINDALDKNFRKQHDFATTAQYTFKQYKEAANDGAAFANTIVGGGLKQAEDALVNFYKTGKISLGGLFQFMADEFLRQVARMQIAKVFDQNGTLNQGLSKIGEAAGKLFKDTSYSDITVDKTGIGIGAANQDFRKFEHAQASSILPGDLTQGVPPANWWEDTFSTIKTKLGSFFSTAFGTGGGLGGGIGGAASTTASFTALTTTGITPATAALGAFTLALDAATTAAGGQTAGSAAGGIGGLLGGAGGGGKVSPDGNSISGTNYSDLFGAAEQQQSFFSGLSSTFSSAFSGIAGLLGFGGGAGGAVSSIAGGVSQQAATTLATTGLTSLATTGALPATSALVGLSAVGLGPATAALGVFTTAVYNASASMGGGSGAAGLAGLFAGSGAGAGAGTGNTLGGVDFSDLVAGADGAVVGPQGRVAMPRITFTAFADGGVFGPFGKVPLQQYSRGGIADRPQLALFGEGRKKEAYIPLDDGKTIQLATRREGGTLKLYVPLPSGEAIPVSLRPGHSLMSKPSDDRLAGAPYMNLPDGRKLHAFASGGVMSGYGREDLPIRAFADGGIGGDSSSGVPYVPGSRAPAPQPQGRQTGGNVHVEVHNYADGTSVKTEEDKDENGETRIRFIIEAAVAEVDRRIDRGGSTAKILKAKGVSLNRGLPTRR